MSRDESAIMTLETACIVIPAHASGDDRVDICVLQLLRERGTRYLLGTSMTEYDCELMPRLHHIRVAGMTRCCFLL